MDTARLSITIPKAIYQEISVVASMRKIRLSHLITEALRDKLVKIRQDEFVRKVNQAFSDPDIEAEQHAMAELIASNTDLEEFPW